MSGDLAYFDSFADALHDAKRWQPPGHHPAAEQLAPPLHVEGDTTHGEGLQITPADDVEVMLAKVGTESSMALAFVHASRGRLLYCAKLGGWLEWAGTHWRRDELRLAYHYCARMARSLGDDTKSMGRASFAAGMERIASAEPAVARLADIFDRDLDLLATPQGVLDLRTGTMRPARPDDLMTRCTSAAPETGEPVRWLDFLRTALDNDEARVEFVREWLGYCMTGRTGLEQFLYLDGPGGNGKGVIATAMRCILGDYYQQAPAQLLLYSPLPQHPTSIAALRGARCVVASELPPGARLDEQRLKSLTGGDPQRARLMRQDEFEFNPELKLLIAANHRPRIVRPDEAMRRRLRVLSMPRVIERPDPAFKHQIIPDEAPRIMAWLIEGAARVIERGERIEAPQRVVDDSRAYLGSQDALGQFIDEACKRDVAVRERRSLLYDAFRRWATEAGEHFTPSARDFYLDIEQRGYRLSIYAGERCVQGLQLLPAFLPDKGRGP